MAKLLHLYSQKCFEKEGLERVKKRNEVFRSSMNHKTKNALCKSNSNILSHRNTLRNTYRNSLFNKKHNRLNKNNDSDSNLKNKLRFSSTTKSGNESLISKNSFNIILNSPFQQKNLSFLKETKNQKERNNELLKRDKYRNHENKIKFERSIAKTNKQKLISFSFSSKRIDKKNINQNSCKKIRKKSYLNSSNISSKQFISPLKSNRSINLFKVNLPIPNFIALKLFSESLNNFEKDEILDYPIIYFIGKNKVKSNQNFGINDGKAFEDEDHNYKILIGDHISYQYEIIQIIGKGSFGQAIKCLDHKTQNYVAIKILRNKKKFIYQTQVEIDILSHIKKEDPENVSNTIQMIEHFKFRNHTVTIN